MLHWYSTLIQIDHNTSLILPSAGSVRNWVPLNIAGGSVRL